MTNYFLSFSFSSCGSSAAMAKSMASSKVSATLVATMSSWVGIVSTSLASLFIAVSGFTTFSVTAASVIFTFYVQVFRFFWIKLTNDSDASK